MSTPTSHNFDIPSFAFHPSRFTLLSHVANLFLLKGNPYNLNLLLILEHPKAELLYCLKTRQMRPIMASTHPSTNQKLVRHWPNSMYPRLCVFLAIRSYSRLGVFVCVMHATVTWSNFTDTIFVVLLAFRLHCSVSGIMLT